MTEREILHDAIRIAYGAQHGIKESVQPTDSKALLRMAEKQNIYPLVYYGMGEVCFELKAYKSTVRQIGAIYYVKKMAYLDIVAEMENSGIKTILLKGYSCADKYAEEYLRVSSDCDLFVLPQDEESAQRILEKQGYRCCEERHDNQHHSVWKHDDVGIVELHTKLVEDDIDYVWQSVFDEDELIAHRIRVNTNEGFFYKLPPVEEWVFLFIHTLKHFLQTGLSIQMLLDLYATHIRMGERQAQKALNLISSSSFGKLWKVFYEYIHKYGAGENELENEEALDIISNDLLHSGWMGLKENVRRVSLFDASNKQELTVHTWLYKAKTLARRAFPERRIMGKIYPVVQNKPFFLPYVYAKRLIEKVHLRLNPSEQEKIDAQVRKAAKAERLQLIDSIMDICS